MKLLQWPMCKQELREWFIAQTSDADRRVTHPDCEYLAQRLTIAQALEVLND